MHNNPVVPFGTSAIWARPRFFSKTEPPCCVITPITATIAPSVDRARESWGANSASLSKRHGTHYLLTTKYDYCVKCSICQLNHPRFPYSMPSPCTNSADIVNRITLVSRKKPHTCPAARHKIIAAGICIYTNDHIRVETL